MSESVGIALLGAGNVGGGVRGGRARSAVKWCFALGMTQPMSEMNSSR